MPGQKKPRFNQPRRQSQKPQHGPPHVPHHKPPHKTSPCKPSQKELMAAPSLGIIRLDYDYPASPGDIDCSESFAYDVYYKVVPGFTFEMCQSGVLTEEVEERFKYAIMWLIHEKNVNAITGDCGFMMYFQSLARQVTKKPIFMSSLCQLPAVTCAYAEKEQILIFTANGESLAPMRDLIRDECGVDTEGERYQIIGCEDVDGFEAVANGTKVDYEKTLPGIIQITKESLEKYPESRAILLECTEMPMFADAIRKETGLPVYDAITACDFFMSGLTDNKRFGENDWQKKWDGVQDKYEYGDNLTQAEKDELVNKA